MYIKDSPNSGHIPGAKAPTKPSNINNTTPNTPLHNNTNPYKIIRNKPNNPPNIPNYNDVLVYNNADEYKDDDNLMNDDQIPWKRFGPSIISTQSLHRDELMNQFDDSIEMHKNITYLKPTSNYSYTYYIESSQSTPNAIINIPEANVAPIIPNNIKESPKPINSLICLSNTILFMILCVISLVSCVITLEPMKYHTLHTLQQSRLVYPTFEPKPFQVQTSISKRLRKQVCENFERTFGSFAQKVVGEPIYPILITQLNIYQDIQNIYIMWAWHQSFNGLHKNQEKYNQLKPNETYTIYHHCIVTSFKDPDTIFNYKLQTQIESDVRPESETGQDIKNKNRYHNKNGNVNNDLILKDMYHNTNVYSCRIMEKCSAKALTCPRINQTIRNLGASMDYYQSNSIPTHTFKLQDKIPTNLNINIHLAQGYHPQIKMIPRKNIQRIEYMYAFVTLWDYICYKYTYKDTVYHMNEEHILSLHVKYHSHSILFTQLMIFPKNKFNQEISSKLHKTQSSTKLKLNSTKQRKLKSMQNASENSNNTYTSKEKGKYIEHTRSNLPEPSNAIPTIPPNISYTTSKPTKTIKNSINIHDCNTQSPFKIYNKIPNPHPSHNHNNNNNNNTNAIMIILIIITSINIIFNSKSSKLLHKIQNTIQNIITISKYIIKYIKDTIDNIEESQRDIHQFPIKTIPNISITDAITNYFNNNINYSTQKPTFRQVFISKTFEVFAELWFFVRTVASVATVKLIVSVAIISRYSIRIIKNTIKYTFNKISSYILPTTNQSTYEGTTQSKPKFTDVNQRLRELYTSNTQPISPKLMQKAHMNDIRANIHKKFHKYRIIKSKGHRIALESKSRFCKPQTPPDDTITIHDTNIMINIWLTYILTCMMFTISELFHMIHKIIQYFIIYLFIPIYLQTSLQFLHQYTQLYTQNISYNLPSTQIPNIPHYPQCFNLIQDQIQPHINRIQRKIYQKEHHPSWDDYMMTTMSYMQEKFISMKTHKYNYILASVNAHTCGIYNFSLDLAGLDDTSAAGTSQSKAAILTPLNEDATEKDIYEYRHNIIKHCMEKHKNKGISLHHLTKLYKILMKYIDVIPYWEFDIGTYTGIEKQLTLEEQMVIRMSHTGRVNYQKNHAFMMKDSIQREVSRLIKGWLHAGIAVECDPHELKYISPTLLVNKNKNDTSDKREYRLCIDLKMLNKDTIPFLYDIPNMSTELQKFKGMNSISKLDLRHAFHHIQIEKESQAYCGFQHQGRFYKMIRMGFGFENAPNTFQYCIDRTLYDIPEASAYLDDIYILCKNNEENLEALDRTLAKLRTCGWKLRIDKCSFMQTKVVQLGRVVTGDGITLYDRHINKLLDYKIPQTLKELKSYVGLLNWCQPFIPGLHKVKAQLQLPIKKKGSRFEITKAFQTSFELSQSLVKKYKTKLIYHPSKKLHYCLDIDASNDGFGAVIYQIGRSGLFPIEYYSRLFTTDQRKWHSTTKELFCLIQVLLRFKNYYFTSSRTIFVFTDCNFVIGALRNCNTEKNTKYLRWMAYLAGFNLIMIHKPGKDNNVADWLSREKFEAPTTDATKLTSLVNNIPAVYRHAIINAPDDLVITDSCIPISINGISHAHGEGYTDAELQSILAAPADGKQYVKINYNINMDRHRTHTNVYAINAVRLPGVTQIPLHTSLVARGIHIPPPKGCPTIPPTHLPQPYNLPSRYQHSQHNIPKLIPLPAPPIPAPKPIYIHTPLEDTWGTTQDDYIPHVRNNWRKLKGGNSILNRERITHKILPIVTPLEIIQAQRDDTELIAVRKYIKGNKNTKLSRFHTKHIHKYRILDNAIYCNDNKVSDHYTILLSKTIAKKVIQYHHNSIYNQHNGIGMEKTQINNKYWMEGLNKLVTNTIRDCLTCKLAKSKPRQSANLYPIVTKYFNDMIQIDYKGPVKRAIHGYNYCLTIVDCFTNYIQCVPTKGTTTSHTVVALFKWFEYFGTPTTIKSDGGPAFTSNLFRKTMKQLGIKIQYGNPGQSQSQGKVERVHREINKHIRLQSIQSNVEFVSKMPFDWRVALQLYVIKHNAKVPTSILTPNELVFGINHTGTVIHQMNHNLVELASAPQEPAYLSILTHLQIHNQCEQRNILIEQAKVMKESYERNRKGKPYEYKVGMKVMVNNDKRMKDFDVRARYGINNVPNYIITKIGTHGHVNIRDELTGDHIYDLNSRRLIPYTDDTVYTHELSLFGIYDNELEIQSDEGEEYIPATDEAVEEMELQLNTITNELNQEIEFENDEDGIDVVDDPHNINTIPPKPNISINPNTPQIPNLERILPDLETIDVNPNPITFLHGYGLN